MVRAARISMRIGGRLGLTPGRAGRAVRRQPADLRRVSHLRQRSRGAVRRRHRLPRPGDRGRSRRPAGGAVPDAPSRRRDVAAEPGPAGRRRVIGTGGRAMVEQMANHCSAAGELADRLGLSAEVRAGVEQSYARWDGKGVPTGRRRRRAGALGPDRARGRGVRGLRAHDRRRRRRRDGAVAAGYALRSRGRRRGAERSRRRCSPASTRTPPTRSSTPSRSSERR